MKKIIKVSDINIDDVYSYLLKNENRSIQDVYDELRFKRFNKRTVTENVVLTYLRINRKKLRLADHY